MTWLNFLNDCAWINKMLNASIKSLFTIHYYPLATIHYSLSHAPAPHDGADHSEEKQPAVFVLEMKTNHK